jgi:hypothetical protein
MDVMDEEEMRISKHQMKTEQIERWCNMIELK